MTSNYSVGDIVNVKTPLGFYVFSLSIIESVLALLATWKIKDESILLILYLSLIGVFVLIVILFTIVLIKYPKNLLGQINRIAESIINNLADHNKSILIEINNNGEVNYSDDDKNTYKQLRNMGLIKTIDGKAMRKTDSVMLTELGVFIVSELKKSNERAVVSN